MWLSSPDDDDDGLPEELPGRAVTRSRVLDQGMV